MNDNITPLFEKNYTPNDFRDAWKSMRKCPLTGEQPHDLIALLTITELERNDDFSNTREIIRPLSPHSKQFWQWCKREGLKSDRDLFLKVLAPIYIETIRDMEEDFGDYEETA